MNSKKVAAIIVLYKPNLKSIKNIIEVASKQCDYVFTIDNSDEDNSVQFNERFSLLRNVYYYPLLNNYGIAYAQNIGIEKAAEVYSHYTIFFDQDSIPVPGMVESLVKDYELLKLNNLEVATIGPLPINSQTNAEYKPRIFGHKIFTVSNRNYYKTNQIISSGSLMEIDIFNEVGNFEEQLFIDGVDHEWCWRAKKYGYGTYLSTTTKLMHNLGEGDRKLVGVNIAITSSFRLYYQYRNYIILTFRAYVPLYWKINNLIKYSVKMVYYPILYKDVKVFKKIITGIVDGFKVIYKKKSEK